MAEGFNTFVLGQGLVAPGASDFLPLIQGGGTRRVPVGAISGVNVVSPTGGDDTAMLAAAFSGSANRAVYLSAGTYTVTAPLTVPTRGVVVGEDIHTFEQYDGSTTYNPVTRLQATTHSGWTSGQAVVKLSNYSYVRGFNVSGFVATEGGDFGVHGIDFSSTNVVIMERMSALYCAEGLRNVTTGGSSQVFRLLYCNVGDCASYGVHIAAASGSISDFQIMGLWSNANHGELFLDGVGYGQVSFCRLEDGGTNPGMIAQHCDQIIFTNMFIDRENICVRINASIGCQFIGFRCATYSGAGSYDFSLGGSCTSNKFSNLLLLGSPSSANFIVDDGTDMTGCVIDELNASIDSENALYADNNTEGTVGPCLVSRGPISNANLYATITPSGGTFTPEFMASRNFTLTLSHSGTNTIANASFVTLVPGQSGTFRIVASSTGSDTLAWGTIYKNTPSLTLAANSINYVPYVVSPANNVILFTPVQNAGG